MKKFLKWTGIVLGALVCAAFLGFLYFIPPFTLAPPEDFIRPEAEAAPSTQGIQDPRTKILAERGKYLVQTIGCAGCHTPGGDKGPKFETHYLAGGMKFSDPRAGTSVSRNLTPDPETGLGRRTDDQVKRTLRSGLFAEDGRIFHSNMMPWAAFSNLTEEDRHAIVVFLRTLKPVRHEIPGHLPSTDLDAFGFYGADYATSGK